MTSLRTKRARQLRKSPNAAERALWSVIKARQLGDYKFTRQMPIGPYFADFVCRAHALVIELDGSQHQDNETYDRARDRYMVDAGYSVLRFPAGEVLSDRGAVCDTILAALEDRMEDHVVAPDLRFVRSAAPPMRRGFNSRHAGRLT